jgi:hypothetical protein
LNGRCDSSAFEPPKPELLRCGCKNGGACAQKEDSNEIICKCRPDYEGSDCGDNVARSQIETHNLTANVVFSIFFILLVGIVAAALFLFFKKRNM